MLTCPNPSFDKLHCRHFLQGGAPAQLQHLEWKISNPVVSLFPRPAIQPQCPAVYQLSHTATAGSPGCASLQQNGCQPGGMEDMCLGSEQACSTSNCTLGPSRAFSSRLHASLSEACGSTSTLYPLQHTSSQPGWGIHASSAGEATVRMLSSTLSDALPNLLWQSRPGHACTEVWPVGRADQPASCSSSVNDMSAALRHGPHPSSTPPSDSRPSLVHSSRGSQGPHRLNNFGSRCLCPTSSIFVGLSNAHEQSWQTRAAHTSMQARCYSSQLGKFSDAKQQRMRSSTQSSMQQPMLSLGSASGVHAGPNATSWRPASSSAGPKRIQDKVVTDPRQISAEEVRVVHEDGGHEIKSPTEAFKLATR